VKLRQGGKGGGNDERQLRRLQIRQARENSGAYVVEIQGRKKNVDAKLGDSINLGEIGLCPCLMGLEARPSTTYCT
jgi:hypothetical protein